MSRHGNSAQPWRLLWLFPIALIAALSIVASGGGGGGDGDGIVDPGGDLPVNILPNYNFFLANLPGDSPLTVVVGNLFTVEVDIDGLFPGNLDLNTNANNQVTFVSYRIRRSARVDLTVTGFAPSPLDGTFTVIVDEEMSAMFDEAPGSGAFDVITSTETVVVTILSDRIELSLDGGAPVVFNTWDDLTDIADDDMQESWQRRAALAANALEFLAEQFFNVADVLDELEAITINNPTVQMCDLFPGTPPAGILNQGDITITWLGSGELSEGDDFDWAFNQCWSEDAEEVLDGTVTLENYTETVDTNNNTLFEIGFGGLSGQPGGVIFDLTSSETVDNGGVFTIAPEDILTISGGFALIIQQP